MAEEEKFRHSSSEIEEEEEELSDHVPRMTEIVEEEEEDVHVAVGKDDDWSMDAVRWAVESGDHDDDGVVQKGKGLGLIRRRCLYLIHVYPPLTHIPTPVGKMSTSQVSEEQVKLYMKEESSRRRSLLHKYITLCDNSKVRVETILIESDTTAKAILELIRVLRIRRLVMGTKRFYWRSKRVSSEAETVQKNAPQFCEVTIICDGTPVVVAQAASRSDPSSPSSGSNSEHSSSPSKNKTQVSPRQSDQRNFFDCACFSPKFSKVV